MSKDMVPSFSRIQQFLDCHTMTINIQNAGSLSPFTQYYLPEDLTPQQHYCGNLETSLLCLQCCYTLNVASKFSHFTNLYFTCNISGFHGGMMRKQVFFSEM